MTTARPNQGNRTAVAALRPERAGIRRIGLLGGSFNPAHEGHLHISRLALAHLKLHEVWWLVSPQNPLKQVRGMAPLATRLAGARECARGEAIWVSAMERALGTRYTVYTLPAVVAAFPRTRFVWLMGADLMVQIPHWKNWRRFFEMLPVAVFDRGSYSQEALSGEAARVFARDRVASAQAVQLPLMRPPAWAFFETPVLPVSATEIRLRKAGSASPSGIYTMAPEQGGAGRKGEAGP
jgi:nicotinate-nucleotide adenylyltransferase